MNRAPARCELHKTRTKSVPGEGPADARIMLIGEAPGWNEDQQERPFVGQRADFSRNFWQVRAWPETRYSSPMW